MSVSLTIPNLDDETFRRLQAEAKRRGMAVESFARNVLEKNLPLANSALNEEINGPPYRVDFLLGAWTESEAKEFLDVVADLRRIDPEIWQ